MAQIILNQPIAEIHGALSKRSNIVNRQKKYRVNGRVIHEGKQESYAIQNPRDWKKTPAQGAELANQTAWKRHAVALLRSCKRPNPTDQPSNSFLSAVSIKSLITILLTKLALC